MEGVPRFIQWIYEEAGPPAGVDAGRLQAWAEAFERWLEASSSSAMQNLRLNAWRSYLQSLGKPPWEANRADVDAWTEAGRLEGRSERWLYERLRYLSAFYETCPSIDPAYATEQHPVHNPVQETIKPKIVRFGDLSYLSRQETAALLGAIQQDQSLLGKRDYALFTLLLLSGRMISITSRLRWGDLETGADEIVRIRWPRSRLPPQEMPLLAWGALWTFLKASGRWEAMQPDWTLFPPLLQGSALRIIEGEPAQWSNTQPLKRRNLICILRQYARWAGLNADQVHFSTIRHTAALRMAEKGLSQAEICRRLGIVNNRTLNSYVSKLRAYPKVELWSPAGPEPHEPRGQGAYWAHQGVNPAFKHGVYAESLPEPWLEELIGDLPVLGEVDIEQEPLLWEVGLARLRSIKLLELGKDVTTLEEILRYTNLLCKQGGRMTKAVNEWNRLQREKWRQGKY